MPAGALRARQARGRALRAPMIGVQRQGHTGRRLAVLAGALRARQARGIGPLERPEAWRRR